MWLLRYNQIFKYNWFNSWKHPNCMILLSFIFSLAALLLKNVNQMVQILNEMHCIEYNWTFQRPVRWIIRKGYLLPILDTWLLPPPTVKEKNSFLQFTSTCHIVTYICAWVCECMWYVCVSVCMWLHNNEIVLFYRL